MSAHRSLPFPYIPRYVDGELLYAWVARLHLLNARSDARCTLKELFGSSTGIPSADLPCRLQVFVDRTLTWGPFSSVLDVAGRGTLLPYFSRFMAAERKAASVAAMASDRGEGLKVMMGLVANGFGASTTLRSCKYCDATSLGRYGCRTWLRIHQLPGVWICPIHREPLFSALVQSRQSHRQNLISPVIGQTSQSGLASSSRPFLERIALLSAEALLLDAPPVLEIERARIYLAAIAKHGLTKHGGVNWAELAKCICSEYNEFNGLPFQRRLLSSEHNPLRWLQDLCLRPERALHPICHLLLAGFLFGDLKSFFAANQRHNEVNTTLLGLEQRDSGRIPNQASNISILLKDTKLSCREVAMRAGLSVTTVVLRRRSLEIPIAERRKSLTPSKLTEIVELHQTGGSVAAVAMSAGVSLSTVYRTLATISAPLPCRATLNTDQKRKKYRSRWKQAQASNPFAATKMLRAVAGGAYAWLYRHDRAWLHLNSPVRAITASAHDGRRVDWSARDQELAATIKTAAIHATATRGKNRISSTFLLRATGQETMVRRNLTKLPLVCKALLDHSEDDFTFCQRRRQYAFDALVNHGNSAPEDWQIDRSASIRKRRSQG